MTRVNEPGEGVDLNSKDILFARLNEKLEVVSEIRCKFHRYVLIGGCKVCMSKQLATAKARMYELEKALEDIGTYADIADVGPRVRAALKEKL